MNTTAGNGAEVGSRGTKRKFLVMSESQPPASLGGPMVSSREWPGVGV